MKLIREPVDAVVMFQRGIVNPVIIINGGDSIKIKKVTRSWKERRNLRDCCIYLCQAEGRSEPLELRWELESNRWFIERI